MDEKRLRRLYSEVTYNMCCDVHGERRHGACATDQKVSASPAPKQATQPTGDACSAPDT